MADNDATKEALALSKQVNELKDEVADLKTQLKAKEVEATQSAEVHKAELKAERDRISEVLTLGKEHKQDELALSAISAGKTVEQFKAELLGAYKAQLSAGKQEGDAVAPTDASVAPKNKEEFLATYRALSGTTKSEYYDKHSAILRK